MFVEPAVSLTMHAAILIIHAIIGVERVPPLFRREPEKHCRTRQIHQAREECIPILRRHVLENIHGADKVKFLAIQGFGEHITGDLVRAFIAREQRVDVGHVGLSDEPTKQALRPAPHIQYR